MQVIKYIMACIGLFLFIIGACGLDGDMLVAVVLIAVGSLLVVPYYREFKRGQTIL